MNLCACGCGSQVTSKRKDAIYLRGHSHKRVLSGPDDPRGPNPSGLCQCGCGQQTGVNKTDSRNGNISGTYYRFCAGHQRRFNIITPDDPRGPNPTGLCVCGCGALAPINWTDSHPPNIMGTFGRFLKGHDKFSVIRSGNPSGLCQCGCDQVPPIAGRSYKDTIKGQRRRFCPGHSERINPTPDPETGCWNMPATHAGGYSRVRRGGKTNKPKLGHVYFWEQRHGLVPIGLELDHLCRNRACVNPDHLEAVTHEENTRRIRAESVIPRYSDGLKPTIDRQTGCWNFPVTQTDGYARIWGGRIGLSLLMAHRVFYQEAKGEIPANLQLDHTCRNRACVNPDHLEPVTGAENTLRALQRKASTTKRAA